LNAIEGFVPLDIIRTFAAFLDFCYIARCNVITEDLLKDLNSALQRFHRYRVVFSGTVRDDGLAGFSLPRQHSMVHYHNHIKNFGSPNGLCSSITESKHIMAVKRPWRRSNRYKALAQILKVNERLDKLAAARVDFATRGMLTNPPLVAAILDAIGNDDRGNDEHIGGDGNDGRSGGSNVFNNDSDDDNCGGGDGGGRTFNNSSDNDNDNNGDNNGDDNDNNDNNGDNDHGPVDSIEPLMNEVRLARDKGSHSVLYYIPNFSRTVQSALTRDYPPTFAALGMKIGQHDLPDLVRHFLFYQLNPDSDIEPDDLLLEQCPVLWDSRVSVFHSATATFRAPSNPSGPGGMYREVIRSTPWWAKGEVAGPRRDCVFVDGGGPDGLGMRSLLVARVYLFFRFSYANVEYPCALVHWYTTVGTEPDNSTGLWVVKPEFAHGLPYRSMSVIHLDSIIRGAHLLPKFPSNTRLYREINYTQTLDIYRSFYVNKYIDNHAFELAF